MTNEIILIVAVAYCVFMLLMGLVFKKFPPKEINMLYGYRTKRRMANQQVWDAANNYWINVFLKLNLISFIFPGLFYFVFPKVYVILYTMIGSVVLVLLSIPLTERYLNKHFDKKGNPK